MLGKDTLLSDSFVRIVLFAGVLELRKDTDRLLRIHFSCIIFLVSLVVTSHASKHIGRIFDKELGLFVNIGSISILCSFFATFLFNIDHFSGIGRFKSAVCFRCSVIFISSAEHAYAEDVGNRTKEPSVFYLSFLLVLWSQRIVVLFLRLIFTKSFEELIVQDVFLGFPLLILCPFSIHLLDKAVHVKL